MKVVFFIFAALLVWMIAIAGCVTEEVPIFVTGKLQTVDGVCITIVGDMSYITSCSVIDKIRVNETNYVNFETQSFWRPGSTKISGVRT